jgi:hypothetical protein
LAADGNVAAMAPMLKAIAALRWDKDFQGEGMVLSR